MIGHDPEIEELARQGALLQNPPSSVEMGPVRGTGAGHVGLQGASL